MNIQRNKFCKGIGMETCLEYIGGAAHQPRDVSVVKVGISKEGTSYLRVESSISFPYPRLEEG